MHCEVCGTKLEKKFLLHEGMIPFCSKCNDYRFLKYSVAVSMIILNPKKDKALLVKQYGTGKYRLVAGYVDKGESLEEGVVREMGEEIGRIPASFEFNATMYFERSNTLMCNFVCVLTTEELSTNYEIDEYAWVPLENLVDELREAKVAKYFAQCYFNKIEK